MSRFLHQKKTNIDNNILRQHATSTKYVSNKFHNEYKSTTAIIKSTTIRQRTFVVEGSSVFSTHLCINIVRVDGIRHNCRRSFCRGAMRLIDTV